MELKNRTLKELTKAKADFERTLKANEEKQGNYFLALGVVEKHRIEEDNTILRNELKKIDKAIKQREKEAEEVKGEVTEASIAFDEKIQEVEKIIDEQYKKLVGILNEEMPKLEKIRDDLLDAKRKEKNITGNNMMPTYSVWDALRNKLDDFRTVIADVR